MLSLLESHGACDPCARATVRASDRQRQAVTRQVAGHVKGTSCSHVCLVMSWPVPTIRTACPASSTTMGLQDHTPSLGVIASPL